MIKTKNIIKEKDKTKKKKKLFKHLCVHFSTHERTYVLTSLWVFMASPAYSAALFLSAMGVSASLSFAFILCNTTNMTINYDDKV
jgi:hypothetical protein